MNLSKLFLNIRNILILDLDYYFVLSKLVLISFLQFTISYNIKKTVFLLNGDKYIIITINTLLLNTENTIY